MYRVNLDFPEIVLLKHKHLTTDSSCLEVYNYESLSQFNINHIFIVEYESFFKTKYLLRGFYIQDAPYQQNLLIRCESGCCQLSILDVRKSSDYYGKKIDVILSRDERDFLFVPRGFAIAFFSLEENTLLHFKSDSLLSENLERIINPFDPALDCIWPEKQLTISLRDASSPYLCNLVLRNCLGYEREV